MVCCEWRRWLSLSLLLYLVPSWCLLNDLISRLEFLLCLLQFRHIKQAQTSVENTGSNQTSKGTVHTSFVRRCQLQNQATHWLSIRVSRSKGIQRENVLITCLCNRLLTFSGSNLVASVRSASALSNCLCQGSGDHRYF